MINQAFKAAKLLKRQKKFLFRSLISPVLIFSTKDGLKKKLKILKISSSDDHNINGGMEIC